MVYIVQIVLIYHTHHKAKKILTAANKESYTPTSYYHPATKKYVDDSLANLDVDVETTETVIFSSADTKEQRKEKFFHLVELYNSGKKFNTFFKM